MTHTYTKNYSLFMWASCILSGTSIFMEDPLSPLLMSVPREILETTLNLEVSTCLCPRLAVWSKAQLLPLIRLYTSKKFTPIVLSH